MRNTRACKAYIASQRHEGWTLARERYDDGGISGGTMEGAGLKALLADVTAGRIDVIVIYKIDRLRAASPILPASSSYWRSTARASSVSPSRSTPRRAWAG